MRMRTDFFFFILVVLLHGVAACQQQAGSDTLDTAAWKSEYAHLLPRTLRIELNPPLSNWSKQADMTREMQADLNIRIDPEIPFRLRAISDSVAELQLGEALQFASDYTISVQSASKRQIQIQDQVVRSNVPYIVRTPALTRPTVFVRQQGDRTQIHLSFNLPVLLEDVQKHVELYNPQGKLMPFQAEYFTYQITPYSQKDSKSKTNFSSVVLSPKYLLPRGPGYKLVVRSDMKPFEGYRSLPESFQEDFTVEGPTHFLGISTSPYVQPQKTREPIQTGKPIYLVFSQALDATQVLSTNDIKISPETKIHSVDIRYNAVKIQLDLEAGTQYSLELTQPLLDDSKIKIQSPVHLNFLPDHHVPTIRLPDAFLVLDSDPPVLPIQLVNVSNFTLEYLLLSNKESIAQYKRLSFYEKQKFFRSTAASTTRVLEPKPDTLSKYFFQLNEIFQEPSGLLLYRLAPLSNEQPHRIQEAAISTLSLMLMLGYQDGFAVLQNSTTKEPIRNARFYLYQDDNQSFQAIATSDSNGQAHWSHLALSTTPLLFVEHAGQVLMADPKLYALWGDFSLASEQRAFVFTDRSQYHPQEEVLIQGIARQRRNNRWVTPILSNASIQISSPNIHAISNLPLSLGTDGSFSTRLRLPQTWKPGYYSLRLRHPFLRLQGLSGFTLVERKPASAELQVQSTNPSWTWRERFHADVLGRYLYGQSLSGVLRYEVILEPSVYRDPRFPGYRFDPYTYWSTRQVRHSSPLLQGEQNFSNGLVRLESPLNPAPHLGNARLVLSASSRLPNGEMVIAPLRSWDVRPPVQIGVRLSQSIFRTNEAIPLQIIALNNQGQVAKDHKVQVEILKSEWVSVELARSFAGQASYRSEERSKKVTQKQVRLGHIRLPFRIDQAGSYLARIRSLEYPSARTEIRFYVSGKDGHWQLRSASRLGLSKDKTSYQVGETASILVETPLQEGQLMVSVAQDTILQTDLKKLQQQGNLLQLPITEDWVPGATVTVLLSAQEPTSSQKRKSFSSFGRIYVPVQSQSKHLRVRLHPQTNRYLPSAQASVFVQLKDAADRPVPGTVSLLVIDKGMENLDNPRNMDPFPTFYGEREYPLMLLDMNRWLYKDSFLSEKGEVVGGDGRVRSQKINATGGQVRPRTQFQYTAFTMPFQRIPAQGTNVQFLLPEQLSTFQVIAVAASGDSFGHAQSQFSIQKDVSVHPMVPAFLRDKDTSTIQADISTLYPQEPLTVQILTNGHKLKEATFSNTSQAHIQAQLSITNPVQVTFQATQKTAKDSIAIDIPLIHSELTESMVMRGIGSNVTKELETQDSIDLSVRIGNSIRTRIQSLRNAIYVHTNQSLRLWINKTRVETDPAPFRKAMSQLVQYLRFSGELNYFPNEDSLAAYETMEALLMLQNHPLLPQVPSSLLNRLLDVAKKYANKEDLPSYIRSRRANTIQLMAMTALAKASLLSPALPPVSADPDVMERLLRLEYAHAVQSNRINASHFLLAQATKNQQGLSFQQNLEWTARALPLLSAEFDAEKQLLLQWLLQNDIYAKDPSRQALLIQAYQAASNLMPPMQASSVEVSVEHQAQLGLTTTQVTPGTPWHTQLLAGHNTLYMKAPTQFYWEANYRYPIDFGTKRIGPIRISKTLLSADGEKLKRPYTLLQGQRVQVLLRVTLEEPVYQFYLTDAIPAGAWLEKQDFPMQAEVYKDRVVFRAYHLKQGSIDIRYFLYAAHPGSYQVPGAYASLENDPDILSSLESSTLTIQ